MNNDSLKGKTLLIVDDEADLREIISMEMEYFGAKVFQAESVKMAVEILNKEHVDLIISDIRMPESTGVDLLKTVKKDSVNDPAVVLITGFADIDTSEALGLGAEALIHKPFDMDELLKTVNYLSKKYPNRYLREAHAQGSLHFYYDRPLNEEINQSVFFGRGGVKIFYKDQPVPLGHQRIVELHFKDKTLTFEGVVRWKKLLDDGASMGIEFTSLNEDMIHTLAQFQNTLSYIPS